MTPYPNRARALHQLARHTAAVAARPPTEFEQRMAEQARVALAGLTEAARPMREAMVRMGAARDASFAQQLVTVTMPRLKVELARSAPAVLVMTEIARQMRRPA